MIIRGRVNEDGDDDFAVKIRPLDAGNPSSDFVANLKSMPGVECESDQMVGQAPVESCAIKNTVRKNLIGEKDVTKLFSKEQMDLLDLLEFKKLPDLSALESLGPAKAKVWKHKCMDRKLTIEVWTLPEKTIAEISTRFGPGDPDHEKTFINCVKDEGINTRHPQEMKTREALEYFSRR